MNQKSQIELRAYGTSEGAAKGWDTRGRLEHAVTEYDRKQSRRAGYNPHALVLYLEAVDRVMKEASHCTMP